MVCGYFPQVHIPVLFVLVDEVVADAALDEYFFYFRDFADVSKKKRDRLLFISIAPTLCVIGDLQKSNIYIKYYMLFLARWQDMLFHYLMRSNKSED